MSYEYDWDSISFNDTKMKDIIIARNSKRWELVSVTHLYHGYEHKVRLYWKRLQVDKEEELEQEIEKLKAKLKEVVDTANALKRH